MRQYSFKNSNAVVFSHLLKWVTLCCFTSLLFGCAQQATNKPDLQSLYALQNGNPEQPPIILIHGLTGSRLQDPITQQEVWPGSLRNILFSDYARLRNSINPTSLAVEPSNLAVAGITDSAVGRDFYGKIIDTLVNAGGYERATLQSINPKQQSLYIFTYDWRQDNVKTAQKLHAFIQSVKAQHQQPLLKVDVVAHSMGGLITRYYARYGTEDVTTDNDFVVTNAGAKHLRRVILLGTPNFGSISSVDGFINGVKVGLNRIPPEVLITFPSGYQLLPHALNDWLIDINGNALDLDVFDISTWENLQLSIFEPTLRKSLEASNSIELYGNDFKQLSTFMQKHLERARRFTWSLTVPLPEADLSYIVFGGNCELTLARGLLENNVNEGKSILFDPEKIRNPKANIDYKKILLEPGDGTVTKASLLARQSFDPTIARHRYSNFPLAYSFFLCESHDALTGNVSFQDNLLNVLLSVDENF